MFTDRNSFTPWTALAGGLLIGAVAAMFVLLNGRIAGTSGIVVGLLQPNKGDMAWRAAFVVGMVLAPAACVLFGALPRLQIDASWPALLVA